MRRTRILGLGIALAALVAGACDDEAPTSLGGDIVGNDFETYVVVLDGDAFLQSDTTYDGIGTLNGVPFALVAQSFEGELFAHALLRPEPPAEVSWEDEDGRTVRETDFTVVGGTLRLILDPTATHVGPAQLEVRRVTETWDAGTATWEVRADTGDVPLLWDQEGGTTGALVGSALWESGDTIEIPLDSAAATAWTDTATARLGGLIQSTSDGSRLRFQFVEFDFNVRPATDPDTIVPGGSVGSVTTLATPAPSIPAPEELRVGGVPIWRSALRFRRLGEIEIPCGPDATACTVPIADVTVNQATLLLHPLPVGARRIERPMIVENRGVLRAPAVPVSRSPLTAALGATIDSIRPAAFTVDPTDAGPVELPVTRFVRLRHLDPAEGVDAIEWLSILADDERSSPIFGYATFGSLQSTTPPELRLVVTAPVRREDP